MAIGTIDILYTVKLGDGSIVEMTSGQLARYRFVMRFLMKPLWYMFAPVRVIYNFVKGN